MNEFKTFHPLVNFAYFAFVIAFSVLLMHPAALIISFACAFAYSVMCGGKKAVKLNIIYMLPVMLFSAAVNPLFNHEGITILAYFKNDNPLTLESIVYGAAAAVMLSCVICHFSSFNRVITSDKLMYLFGRIIPTLSLALSMTLRFVPRFAEQLKKTDEAQRMLFGEGGGSVIKKLRRSVRVLSITVTWALESSVITADSMRSRGYGEKIRTAYTLYRFERRDGIVLSVILILGAWMIYAYIKKYIYFVYFPTFSAHGGALTYISLAAYFILCAVPIVIEIKEAVRWKNIKSQI